MVYLCQKINTEIEQYTVQINYLLYDANGKVMAITGTSVTDLKAGSTTSFECSCMFADDNATIDSIKDYKVIAQTSYFQW